MSNFKFVDDLVLRNNLDIAFSHVVDLIPLCESSEYDTLANSSFRKTTIVYTASIIEALLLFLLKNKFSESDLNVEEWELKNKKVLYKVNNNKHEIIAGDYKLEVKTTKFDKLNL